MTRAQLWAAVVGLWALAFVIHLLLWDAAAAVARWIG